MIVVSDTSPINYLVLIEFQNLLPELFDLESFESKKGVVVFGVLEVGRDEA